MKIVKLSKKDYRRKFGKTLAHTIRTKGMESTIHLPKGANTRTKLHEIYHATKSPHLKEIEMGKKWLTSDELALEELRAQIFTSKMMGMRDLPWRMIGSVARALLSVGYKPATIMGSIKRALDTEGYEPLNNEYRSTLWKFLKAEFSNEKS